MIRAAYLRAATMKTAKKKTDFSMIETSFQSFNMIFFSFIVNERNGASDFFLLSNDSISVSKALGAIHAKTIICCCCCFNQQYFIRGVGVTHSRTKYAISYFSATYSIEKKRNEMKRKTFNEAIFRKSQTILLQFRDRFDLMLHIFLWCFFFAVSFTIY